MNCWTTIEGLSAQICGLIDDAEDKTIKYKIQISFTDQFSWILIKRYSDFFQLHKKLTENGIPLDGSINLPPKRMLGNKDPDFIEHRRQQLDSYLSAILRFFKLNPPEELITFLQLTEYQIMFLLKKMAIDIFEHGDELLATNTSAHLTPYQIYGINERMKMAVPSLTDTNDKRQDFSHILDFCTRLTLLDIIGSNIPIGSSTIIPNTFKFSLQPFKNVKQLKLKCVNVGNIAEIGSVRSTVEALLAQNCDLESSNSLLLADSLYKTASEVISSSSSPSPTSTCSPSSTISSQYIWPNLRIVNLSNNKLTNLTDIGILIPNLNRLDISFNNLSIIFNLTGCPFLDYISYAGNSIVNLPTNLNLLFGQICHLDLSSNQLIVLEPLQNLYSLVELNLSCNRVYELEQVSYLGQLPCLEVLSLTGNPVASAIDFRVRTFTFFKKRAIELTLDNEKASSIELDQIQILLAIQTAKETAAP